MSEALLDAARLDDVRRLTLRYVYASTAIFFASGAMGVVLRFTQADVPGRLGDNFWYALMTAHGLGAFVGWAAFAVMGFAWWILASVGLAARGFGYAMGVLTWWLMVLGTAGVIVTTLLMSFAASWVFLYPLPFQSAGQWSDLAAGIFSGAVLLAGLAIVTWCLGILHTVVGPGLHAVSGRFGNRLGVALGMGYLFPRTFATNPRSVPYPVIPLTVIGIDMIIATLPLAGLLVWMILQSIWPGMSVDPLLAKNILWFFGHPVVYLLLFPAVAMFYYLVPRYAGRGLVAGNVVAVAWLVAVTANVLIWAHHVYLDYPEDTFQGWLNTLHQPLTFAIVLPSALSLYSLAFTIFRSDWRWGAAQTALFLALLSWFLAGLQGIVNATIAFQETIHNTLWIVGHFHHMAFANIGLVIVAGIYAFLPELTGKSLYSESLAKFHVWATFVGVTGNSVLWLWQGLEGGPRRFAVLPDAYAGTLTYVALPFVALIAVAQLPFAYNIVQTLRGVEPKESRRTWADATVEGLAVLAALFLVCVAVAAGFVVGRATAPDGGRAATTPAAAAPGAAVFADAGCGSCHAFAPAGSSASIGPSLDTTQLDAAAVEQVVANGRRAMPAFAGRLTDEEIEAVSAYVAGGG